MLKNSYAQRPISLEFVILKSSLFKMNSNKIINFSEIPPPFIVIKKEPKYELNK